MRTAELLKLALPMILLSGCYTFIQLTDAWIVGRLGSEALAALGAAGLMVFLLLSFGYAYFSVITMYVAQLHATNRDSLAGSVVFQGVLVGLFWASILFCLRGWVPKALAFFDYSETIKTYAGSYVKISILGLFPLYAGMVCSNFFLGIQKTWIPLLAGALAMVINFLATYGLVFGAFGLPKWGFEGAAWGTVIAVFFECLVLAGFIFSSRYRNRFGMLKWRFDVEIQKKINRIGLPAGLQSAFDVLAWGILLVWLISFYSLADQAAAAILLRCIELSVVTAEGLALAMLTLTAEKIGETDFDGAREVVHLGFRWISGYMVVVGLSFFCFRFQIAEMFSSDPEVIAVTATGMIFVSIFQYFDAMNVTYIHGLQAVGDSLWAFLCNVILGVGIFLSGGLAMVHFAPFLGSEAIWVVATIFLGVQGLALRSRWKSGKWEARACMEEDLVKST